MLNEVPQTQLRLVVVSLISLLVHVFSTDYVAGALANAYRPGKGKAAGEEDGGMLQIIEREIEVLCLPQEIPDGLELDVSALGIGDALHVKDLRTGVETGKVDDVLDGDLDPFVQPYLLGVRRTDRTVDE